MTIAERDIKLHELQQMPGAIGRMGEWLRVRGGNASGG